jgi:hypothetical protein
MSFDLLHKFGLNPELISGKNRARESSVFLSSMKKYADPYEYFDRAMITELEHGRINEDTNVTDDDTEATAKIVMAHLAGVEADEPKRAWKPFFSYYDHLWQMEKHGRKK